MRLESEQILDVMPIGKPVSAKQIQDMGIKLSTQKIAAFIASDLHLKHVDIERGKTDKFKINLFTRRAL